MTKKTNLKKENKKLRKLCKVKDSYFMELMSDGLRHGSKLAAKNNSPNCFPNATDLLKVQALPT